MQTTKYLYGANVQGIQRFIFQTNRLKEIAGASQLVDNIFNKAFCSFLEKKGVEKKHVTKIMSAAGHIRLILEKEACEKIVRYFPQFLASYATGVTVNQAVVEMTESFKDDIDSLEDRLSTQMNCLAMPNETGFMALKRSRRTGGVAYWKDLQNDEYRDKSTHQKIRMFKEDPLSLFQKIAGDEAKEKDIPFDIEQITKSKEKGWLAIVHADGNGLGKLLRKLLRSSMASDQLKKLYSQFSEELENATRAAAQVAFRAVVPVEEEQEIKENENKYYPFRPVLLGGDDLSIIIRADLAFEFTKTYLEKFEEKTKEHFQFMHEHVKGFEKGLTACAGIAYVKTSYPFHYGIDLAEKLTSAAKRFSKGIYKGKKINQDRAPSSLYFYKVQSSFVGDLASMIKRTHVVQFEEFEADKASGKSKTLSFDYGPYLVTEKIQNRAQAEDLAKKLATISEKKKISKEKKMALSKLREWLTVLHHDEGRAKLIAQRIKQKNKDLYETFELEQVMDRVSDSSSIIQDVLTLNSF